MNDSFKNSLAWVRRQSLRTPSFVPMLLTGILLSVLTRWLVDGNKGAVAALAVCVAFLAVYAYQSRDKFDLHAPENLYYMGLLFTLASLIYSLVVLFIINSGEVDVEERVYNLVGSFGIALVSTFVGIFLRIMLLQKSILQDESEIEGKVRRDIADTARKLREELRQMVADTVSFRRAMVQATKETVRETDKARDVMVQQSKKAVSDQADMLADLTEKVGGKLTKAGGDIAEASGHAAKGIRDALGEVNSSGESIEDAFKAVLDQLKSVARDMQEANQKNISVLSEGYNSLNAEIKQTTRLFSSAAGEVENAAKIISAGTEALSNSMVETANTAPQHAEQISQSVEVLRQEAEKWQSMTQKVRTSMIQAVKSLTDAIQGKKS
ncbi:MAG: hypothetical protein MPK31_01745 [Gammaproteobacteria bacterium]|nr:hypothetical protein [Gammaproteobacteria bacterium]MDA8001744.1 hypothetical protein [Alphaproteobacteria bacterium]